MWEVCTVMMLLDEIFENEMQDLSYIELLSKLSTMEAKLTRDGPSYCSIASVCSRCLLSGRSFLESLASSSLRSASDLAHEKPTYNVKAVTTLNMSAYRHGEI